MKKTSRKTKTPAEVGVTLVRVRRTTRKGKRGLLFVGIDDNDKEFRWVVPYES